MSATLRAEIFNEAGDEFIRFEERVPVCGEDFCDNCGDCLACYWESPCPGQGGVHRFVVYGETADKEEE